MTGHTEVFNPIALKFGTHERAYRKHLGNKFGLNASISGSFINS